MKSKNVRKKQPWLFAIGIILLLGACNSNEGSGGAESNPDPAPGETTNTPPTASAGINQTVNEGDLVMLAGSGNDAEGGVTFLWEQLSGPSVILSSTSNAAPNFAAPEVDGDTALNFRLTVTDSDGESVADTVIVNVANIGTTNTPPTANAGADQTVAEGELVQLTGVGNDLEGVVIYLWEQVSGVAVGINHYASATPDFTAPDVSSDSDLEFRLTVTDEGGLSTTDITNVTIQDLTPVNTPPFADAGMPQNIPEGVTVTLDGLAMDAEGDVTTLWSQLSGPTVSFSDASSLSTSFVAPELETGTVDLVFELLVTDSEGLTASGQVTVTVNNVASSSGNAPWRLSTMTVDFDFNGIAEGEKTFFYNPDGSIARTSYVYTDDGVSDAEFGSFSLGPAIGDQDAIEEFTYDTSGRLESWTITSGTRQIVQSFTWVADSQFNTVVQEVYDIGNLSSRIEFMATYTSNLLTHVDGQVTFPQVADIDLDLNYDANNNIENDLWQFVVMGTTLSEFREFTWNTDGAIEAIRTTDPTPGATYESLSDFIYTKGRITERQHVVDAETYSWGYSYNLDDLFDVKTIDLARDSVIDAAIYYQWEEESCTSTVAWVPRAEPDSTKRLDDVLPLPNLGDGHTLVAACGYPEGEVNRGVVTGSTTSALVPTTTVDPFYPTRAEARGIEGFCELEFTVDETGAVVNPVITSENPSLIFGRSCSGAITDFVYTPREENGVPVSTSGVNYRFEFTIE